MKNKMITLRFWITGAIIALFVSPVSVAADATPTAKPMAANTAEQEKAIRAVFGDYIRALKAGDSKGWLALWDDNGTQLPPGQPMHVGKAAIAAANAPGIEKFKEGGFDMEIQAKEVVIFLSDGFAFASGVYHWEMALKGPEAKTNRFEGKFLTVFKRQPDGSWKIFRDAFNANSPNR